MNAVLQELNMTAELLQNVITKIQDEKPQYERSVHINISKNHAEVLIQSINDYFEQQNPNCIFEFVIDEDLDSDTYPLSPNIIESLIKLNQDIRKKFLQEFAKQKLSTKSATYITKKPKTKIVVPIQVQKEFYRFGLETSSKNTTPTNGSKDELALAQISITTSFKLDYSSADATTDIYKKLIETPVDPENNIHLNHQIEQHKKYVSLLQQKNNISEILSQTEWKSWLESLHSYLGADYVYWYLNNIELLHNRKIDLTFLLRPEIKIACVHSPMAMVNLERLSRLSNAEVCLWNNLITTQDIAIPLDFNNFFVFYTQTFLRKCKELNIVLQESVIKSLQLSPAREGVGRMQHILQILQSSTRPQEQLLHICGLDLELVAADEELRNCKFICKEMLANDPEIKSIYKILGKYWPSNVSFNAMQELLQIVDKNPAEDIEFTLNLRQLFATSFSTEPSLTDQAYKQQLQEWLGHINTVAEPIRSTFIKTLRQTGLSLNLYQLKTLANLAAQAGDTLQCKNIIETLQNEGWDLFNTVIKTQQKLGKNLDFTQLNNFINTLSSYRHLLSNLNTEHKNQLLNLLVAMYQEDENLNDYLPNIIQKITQTSCSNFLKLFLTIQIQTSKQLPKLKQLNDILNKDVLPITEETLTIEHGFNACKFGVSDLSSLDHLITDGIKETIANYAPILNKFSDLNTIIENEIDSSSLLSPTSKKSLKELICPLLNSTAKLIQDIQQDDLNFEQLQRSLKKLELLIEHIATNDINIGITILGLEKSFNKNGKELLKLILSGDHALTTGFLDKQIIEYVYTPLNSQLINFFENKDNKNKIGDLTYTKIKSWIQQLTNNFTFTFFFKDELVSKKVVPAIRKRLQELDLPHDLNLIKNILQIIEDLNENKNTSQSLENYKSNIECVCNIINQISKFKLDFSESEFNLLVNHPLILDKYIPVKHLAQLLSVVQEFLHDDANNFLQTQEWLDLFSQELDGYKSEKTDKALDHIYNSLKILTNLTSLSDTQKKTFVSMIIQHSMRTQTAFPIQIIAKIKQLEILEDHKNLLLNQIINTLPRLESADITKHFLIFLKNVFDSNYSEINANRKILSQEEQILLNNYNIKSQIIGLTLSNIFPKYPRKNQSNAELQREQDESLLKLQEIIDNLGKLKDEDRANQSRIIVRLLENKNDQSLTLARLREIAYRLNQQPEYTKKLADNIFSNMPPYPNASYIEELLLSTNDEKRHNALQNFDLNPFPQNIDSTRDLEHQFDITNLAERIADIKNLFVNHSLPSKIQIKLAEQLTYIENIGHEITKTPRLALQQHASLLLSRSRQEKLNTREKLELLAYLREIYFRTIGKFPNSTQVLTLLLSEFDNVENTNLLMQIRTGEGKSIITPLLAILQWTRGGTVDVCTANQDLLTRDYEESCKPFFDFFRGQDNQPLINTTVVQANSEPKTYKMAGINFSTLENLALFRLNIHENKQEHLITDVRSNGRTHLVLDECDDALLDQNTLYQLTKPSTHTQKNELAWLFRLVREFVLSKDFQESAATLEDDVFNFRGFLKNKTQNDIVNYNWIDDCTDVQLLEWIQATITAEQYQEKKDYLIETKEYEGHLEYICTPLIHSMPQKGCFTQSVQQAILAKIEAKDEKKYKDQCNIRKPAQVIASQSSEQLVQFYQKSGGRLVGISGTPGDRVELETLRTRYNVQALSLPPHAGDQRLNHEPIFTFNDRERVKAICRIIDTVKKPAVNLEFKLNRRDADKFTANAKNEVKKQLKENSQIQTQPILIIVEDYLEAEKLALALKSYREKDDFDVQVLNEDNKQTRQRFNQFLLDAGHSQTITIATAELARGVDIKPDNHPDGLCVIQTFVDTERLTAQIAGRAARNGKKGCWIPIYKLDASIGLFHTIIEQALNLPILNQLVSWFLKTFCGKYLKSKIEAIQNEAKQRSILQKIYTQETAHYQKKLMSHLEAWEKGIEECFGASEELSSQFWQWRENLQQVINSHIELELNHNDIEQQINIFKNKLTQTWENFKDQTILPYLNSVPSINISINEINNKQLIIEYLQSRDFEAELEESFDRGEELQAFKASVEKMSLCHVKTALADKAGAQIKYGNPTQEEKNTLQQNSIKQNIQLLVYELSIFDFESCLRVRSILSKLSSTKSDTIDLEQLIQPLLSKTGLLLKADEILKDIAAKMYLETESIFNQQSISSEALQNLYVHLNSIVKEFDAGIANLSLKQKLSIQSLLIICKKIESQIQTQENEVTTQAISAEIASSQNKIKTQFLVYLKTSFKWVNEPLGINKLFSWFHEWLHRDQIQTLKKIYDSTQKIDNEINLAEVITQLRDYQIRFKDKPFFSFLHKNPLDVIETMMEAIQVVEYLPDNISHEQLKNIEHETKNRYWIQNFKEFYNQTSAIEAVSTALVKFDQEQAKSTEKYLQLFCHLHKIISGIDPKNTLMQKHIENIISNIALNIESLEVNPLNSAFIELQSQLFTHNISKPIRRLNNGHHQEICVQLTQDEAARLKSNKKLKHNGYQRPAKLLTFFNSKARDLEQQISTTKANIINFTDKEEVIDLMKKIENKSIPMPKNLTYAAILISKISKSLQLQNSLSQAEQESISAQIEELNALKLFSTCPNPFVITEAPKPAKSYVAMAFKFLRYNHDEQDEDVNKQQHINELQIALTHRQNHLRNKFCALIAEHNKPYVEQLDNLQDLQEKLKSYEQEQIQMEEHHQCSISM